MEDALHRIMCFVKSRIHQLICLNYECGVILIVKAYLTITTKSYEMYNW